MKQCKSPRLQGYDYSQAGAYFVTICTHQRQHLFGDIQNGVMNRSDMGAIAATCWNAISDHYPDVNLDAFVVMPTRTAKDSPASGIDVEDLLSDNLL